jgi:hypothetical protein
MKINWHIELLRHLEDRPKSLVIDRHAVGEDVERRSLKSQFSDSSLKLLSGLVGHGRGKRGKCLKSARVPSASFGEAIVDPPREPNCNIW